MLTVFSTKSTIGLLSPPYLATSVHLCIYEPQCLKADSPTSVQGLSRSDVSAAVLIKFKITSPVFRGVKLNHRRG